MRVRVYGVCVAVSEFKLSNGTKQHELHVCGNCASSDSYGYDSAASSVDGSNSTCFLSQKEDETSGFLTYKLALPKQLGDFVKAEIESLDLL